MDVRGKLVELLQDGDNHVWGWFPNNSTMIQLADYLISHGVTVQEWIPVMERLPEEGAYALCVLKGFNYGGKIQVCKFVPADKFKDKPYFEHFRNGFPSVTHWMPLPQPPKGE